MIVGASLAGFRVAEGLRAGGYDGAITLLGEEPHRPYDRPPLSKQYLAGQVGDERLALRSSFPGDLDVRWRLGEKALGLDPARRAVRTEAGEIEADAIVIATGSVPRRPSLDGPWRDTHVLRTLEDARSLREALAAKPRLVIIGGGFIGMEVAATARGLGVDVTVLEAAPQPMMRGLGPVLGAWMAERHRAEGVDLRCGAQVAGLDASGELKRIRLADGSAVEAELVLVAIGVRPATDWLQDSGLDISDGVRCDATGFTGVPGVFAAGDAACWYQPRYGTAMRFEHWTAAQQQGAHVAHRILHGEGTEPLDAAPYVWTDQYDVRLQIVGRITPGDEMAVRAGSLAEGRFVALFGRDGRIVGAAANRRPRAFLKARELVNRRSSWSEALAAIES